MVAAAQPMQGAVFRGTGSASMFARGTWGSAFAVASTRRLPVAMYTRSGGTSGASLRTVAARSVSSSSPASARSCLGRSSREAGQKRVPAPPAMITA
jgi:hypothetical protein